MRRAGVALAVALLAGCGGSGIEGTLEWAKPPSVSAHALRGVVRNTTSDTLTLDTHAMRLLDVNGRRVRGRFHVAHPQLAKGASETISATWKSGKPVRIDYGAGTLPLSSS